MSRDARLYDGEGRNPYDLYDGEGQNPYDLYDGEPVFIEDDEEDCAVPPKYVEVTYCKDCKYRNLPFQYPTGCHWNPEEEPEDDDYCSAGVPKNGT